MSFFNSKVKSSSNAQEVNVNQNITGSIGIKNPLTKEGDSTTVAIIKTGGAIITGGVVWGASTEVGKIGMRALLKAGAAFASSVKDDVKAKKAEKEVAAPVGKQ